MKRSLIPVTIISIVALAAALVFFASAHIAKAGGNTSNPIVIQSDNDFTTCGCVSSGSGSPSNPYVIGPLTINNANGVAVSIDGTNLTKSFELLNLSIAGNSVATDTGIVLNHINASGSQTISATVYGVQTSIQTNNVGILVENSSYVTLDGAGENPKGQGVAETGAGTINKNTSGAIDVENSSHITIKGWQLSTNGPSINPNWVTLDPSVANWAVGGVRFFGVTNSTIDHNSANNDTDVSYSLFHSSNNTLSNNTADYPFTMNYLVTDGSSYNTLTNNEGSTGDFIGLMVADPLQGTSTLATYGPSHDNQIIGNTIHTNGPTGTELNPVSITPAFLGGIVVLNGTYNNTIKNNQTWGSFGSDLAWAQAVPDSTTPIGVKTYPPTLHCNVTQYNGTATPAPALNGNVWTGNTYQTIDSCLPAQ
jgi:parallel beta-helix repeat protein